jgi:multidrug efflux pump subunit AcrA (membrane-fusion protein)
MGEKVSKGDVLFTLDSTDAELQLKQAEASYHAAEVAYSNSLSLQNNQSTLIPAQVAYNEAVNNQERILSLYNEGAASQLELDAAKARLDTAKAQLSSASSQSKSSVDTASSQLNSAGAALDIAKQRLEYCVVKSPMDGLVLKTSVKVGDMVSPQTSSITLVDSTTVLLNVSVTESRLGQIEEGMPVDIRLPALDKTMKGAVSKIGPGLNPATGMFDVEIKAINSLNAETGMLAEADLFPKISKQVTSIPAEALRYSNPGQPFSPGSECFILVLTPSTEESAGKTQIGTVRKQSVSVVDYNGNYATISQPIGSETLLLTLCPIVPEDGSQVSYIVIRR